MITITFEEVTEKQIATVQDIVTSNKAYNVLENGRENRTIEEIKKEFLNPKTFSYVIKADENVVGVIDYLDENPKDHYPWLGLFMIHEKFKGRGLGKKAYLEFEGTLIRLGKPAVRLGVLTENTHAKVFWERLGFVWYETKPYLEGKEVACYEKKLKS